MKKAIVILLLLVYGSSAIGATIHVHYCMNQFSGWSFSAEKKEQCPKCGMKNTGCCKDEKKQIKLSSEQQKVACNIQVETTTMLLPKSNETPKHPLVCTNGNLNIAYLHAPPLLLKQLQPSFLASFLI
ncbi:MAG: hypothetical protein RLZ56_1177 [Bacteroidota bacterium]|jgi:hypothetical protein